MSPTTIKVDPAVRDRLAEVARARGVSMGTLLDAESQRLVRELRWREIEQGYERLREDDESWRGYLAELDAWDAGSLDADAAAETDWPEFNK